MSSAIKNVLERFSTNFLVHQNVRRGSKTVRRRTFLGRRRTFLGCRQTVFEVDELFVRQEVRRETFQKVSDRRRRQLVSKSSSGFLFAARRRAQTHARGSRLAPRPRPRSPGQKAQGRTVEACTGRGAGAREDRLRLTPPPTLRTGEGPGTGVWPEEQDAFVRTRPGFCGIFKLSSFSFFGGFKNGTLRT